MAKALTKDDLRKLRGQDADIREVEVPEWGDEAVIRICVMGGADSETFESVIQENRLPDQPDEQGNPGMSTKGIRWALFRRTVVDENNELMFDTEDEARQIMGSLNHKTLMRIFNQALDLNGMGENAVEEAEKNS